MFCCVIHSLKDQLSLFILPPCVSAGTLSVCVNEKFTDLHTAALQFLSTIFTEETKSLGAEVTTSSSKHAATVSDVVSGPSASQLCELLLQVHGGGRLNLIFASLNRIMNVSNLSFESV